MRVIAGEARGRRLEALPGTDITRPTLDQLVKYPEFFHMPLVSGSYWPMVHGNTPEDVKKDEEGLQIMRTLGRNMAWILKCIEAGKKAGIEAPATEAKIMTNFIR